MSFLHRFRSLTPPLPPAAAGGQLMYRSAGVEAVPEVDLGNLQAHLQVALELELSTLPPYLCALYSIPDGSNVEVAGLIRSVLMEEMLHMVLVANLLNAVGGDPQLIGGGIVPRYPAVLPDSDGSFSVSLRKFSREAVATFQRIELPSAPGAGPQLDGYSTIGQFYEGIEAMLRLGNFSFTNHPERQIGPEQFYNGHGNVIAVDSLDSALEALHEICHQGEGLHHTIKEDEHELDALGYELAHYFRFTEIMEGRRYVEGDTPEGGPTGALLPVDWSSARNMISNPRCGWYALGDPRREAMDGCNRTFFRMLEVLEDAMNGGGREVGDAVPLMLEVKERAIGLMNLPSGIGDTVLGPSFEPPLDLR